MTRPGEKFAKVSPETTPAISGWQGETHALAGTDAADEKITVYTDIEQAKPSKLIRRGDALTSDATRFVPELTERANPNAPGAAHYAEDEEIPAAYHQASGIVEGTLTCSGDAGCAQITVGTGAE